MRRTYTERKNFNLMNVRKDRTNDKKPKIYDIENFNVSYAYSRDLSPGSGYCPTTSEKSIQGDLGYNYSVLPKNVSPFSRSKFLPRTRDCS